MTNLLTQGEFKYPLFCFAFFIFGLNIPIYSSLSFLILSIIYIRFRDLLNLKSIVLLVFITSYLFTDPENYLKSMPEVSKIRLILLTLACYLLGKKIYAISREKPNNAIIILCSIQIGWAINAIMSIYYTLQISPELIFNRVFYDYYAKNDSEVHGLEMTASFTVAIASMPFIIFNSIKNKYKFNLFEKLILASFVISGIIGIYINNLMQNRSPFLFAFLSGIILIFFLPNNKYFSKFYYFCIIFGLLSISIIGLSFYGITSDDFLSNGISSRLDREDISTNGRSELWFHGLWLVLTTPFGGVNIPFGLASDSYFHNFWLDVGRVSGYLPLLAILTFQLAHTKAIANIFLTEINFLSGFTAIILTCVFFIFFTEPVPQGMLKIYYLSFIVLGNISKQQ